MTPEELSELVRLIDKNGKNIGLVPLRDAVKLAQGDHLIKITEKASPPVYRIVDSSEYLKNRSN